LVHLHSFLIFALFVGKWSDLRTGQLTYGNYVATVSIELEDV